MPLREQLSAPDMMDVTVEEDHFTILAHAAVRLPETDTIPMITVKAGCFSWVFRFGHGPAEHAE